MYDEGANGGETEHTRLLAFYDRIEEAIRKVDPNHILWLDGNTFAADFSAFNKVLPNCVYALHDYSVCFRSLALS